MKHGIYPIPLIRFVLLFLWLAIGCTGTKKDDVKPEPPAAPQFETLEVNSITDNSAASGGAIFNDAGFPITGKGICFSIFPNPTISNARTSDGSGNGSFTSTMTNLTRNAKYYVRAYITNANGTYYGNEREFTTRPGPVTTPLVTTNEPRDVGSTTVVLSGDVVQDGGATVTARGVCYSRTSNPTLASPRTRDGSGTGSFSSTVTGLMPNSEYFVRAYATNSKGTTYGAEFRFTTNPEILPTVTSNTPQDVTSISFRMGGNVSADNGSPILARGIVYGTSTQPTVVGSKTTEGSGLGNFTSLITGLSPATVYYARAYATNGNGTSYGVERTFTTLAADVPTIPTVQTSEPGSTTTNTASLSGEVVAEGGSPVTARGFCYSLNPNPGLSNVVLNATGTGVGTFTANAGNLLPGTQYYVRAFATNAQGTAFGQERTFTTGGGVVETFTATIGTVAFSASQFAYENPSASQRRIRVTDPVGLVMQMTIPTTPITGNRSFANPNTDPYTILYQEGSVIYRATSGSMIITVAAAGRLEGTFSGTFSATGGLTRTVTNGVFRLRLP